MLLAVRTTKRGGLPNLSYVKRKLNPVGTEFKNIAEGMAGVMLWMELQEGKVYMYTKEYHYLGSIAVCVVQGVQEITNIPSLPGVHEDEEAT